jgi:hypothetical protein
VSSVALGVIFLMCNSCSHRPTLFAEHSNKAGREGERMMCANGRSVAASTAGEMCCLCGASCDGREAKARM